MPGKDNTVGESVAVQCIANLTISKKFEMTRTVNVPNLPESISSCVGGNRAEMLILYLAEKNKLKPL